MNEEMAENVDNPYLLHYKNKSNMIKEEIMNKNLLITPNKSGDPLRDPEEEFFMLAVLTHKMLHNENYDDAEYVYQISAAKMFKEAKQKKLPFHKWYRWLEGKFD